MTKTCTALLLTPFLAASCASPALSPETTQTTGEPQLMALRWEEDRLWLRVPVDVPLLYYVSLPGGLGSNDVGLDRGQVGSRRWVEFRRRGERLLLVAPNATWRSSSSSAVERQGVRDSFAESILWAFEDREGWIDASDFLLRDAHGIARRLDQSGQGSFQLDDSRSLLSSESAWSFPENTEIEAYLTFAGERPGPEVRSTASEPHSPSFRVRHSFLRLPELDGGYVPRPFDPRCGFFPLTYYDLSQPVEAPLRQELIQRHRLDADHPIVYYVDQAAPEPIRSALLEGARYWVPVFAAAGHPDGFRVELLPEGVHPEDARYNVIQWVHRSTRGWSYGDAISDPRSGEILKGHVTLGALRVRQDALLFEGLLSPFQDVEATDERVLNTALDRIRQLAAHEVGHTLGLAHNFAASCDGRSSVMDYPAPWIRIGPRNELDLSEAYRDGCGEWDEMAIRYGYARARPGESQPELTRRVLADIEASGLAYYSDFDARGPGRAHPEANLWDNGSDALEELSRVYQVRRIALDRLGENTLARGRAFGQLEDVLVPVYLHHRYQIEAAARRVGGVSYRHAARGESTPQVRPVPEQEQERALEAVLESLSPEFLRLPDDLLALLPPPPPGRQRGRESFEPGGHLFDPVDAARASIGITLDLLLNPERLLRLIDQAQRDPRQLSFDALMTALADRSWAKMPRDGFEAVLQAEVRTQVLVRTIELASRPSGAPRLRAHALRALGQLRERLDGLRSEAPQIVWERDLLRRFFEEPLAQLDLPSRPEPPPGSPIGCGLGPDARPKPDRSADAR